MKANPVPTICGVALAAMSAAGLSHWWSVETFVSAVRGGLPVSSPAAVPAPLPGAPVPSTTAPARFANVDFAKAAKSGQMLASTTDPSQKAFYEALVAKMENIQNQNRDLLDQMAETNRDVMKLEFRVDTHSESFRPMPLSEEVNQMSYDDGPGVLPPRAEPVFLEE